MFRRFLSILLIALALPTSAADDANITITLRALLEMINEPALATEAAVTAGKPKLSEEELADLRLVMPSRVFQLWLDVVPTLEAAAKEKAEHADIFPPGLAAMLKEDPEVRIKRGHLALSLGRLRALAEAVATPGEASELRKVTVPRAWIDALYTERQAVTMQMLDTLAGRRERGVPEVMRQNTGTFARQRNNAIVKVAEANVPEEGLVVAAPYGEKGTWNLYQIINRPTTWLEAEAAAAKMPAPFGDKAVLGHLVSLRSPGENAFVTRLMSGMNKCWMGLSDRRIECYTDGDGAWEWSSGEPVTWRNWKEFEPNSASNGKPPFDEDGGVLYRETNPVENGFWGDYPDGSSPADAHRFPYIVEWNLNAAQMPDGARLPEPILPADLQGPEGGDGVFGIRIAYGCGSCYSMRSALEAFRSRSGRIVETTIPTLHHREPDKLDYVLLFGDAAPLPEQKAGSVDKDVAMFVRGRIRIADAGTYTFGVHHDDGFAFRIKGAKWKSASGWGTVDPGDPSTLAHPSTSSNATTHGVVELAAGDYEIEFFGFQGQGECYFELYSAKGAFTSDDDTDMWRLVGHKSRGEVAQPGVVKEGWEVEIAPPGSFSRLAFDAAERAFPRRGKKLPALSPIVAFYNPAKGIAPYAAPFLPFPECTVTKEANFFALRAKSTLEIPADGTYWIGYQAIRGGRLTIPGQKWKRLTLAGPGKANLDEDILENNADDTWGQRVIGEIDLKKGAYPIEFLSVHADNRWTSARINSSAAGLPQAFLRAGSAKVFPDHDGLPLVK